LIISLLLCGWFFFLPLLQRIPRCEFFFCCGSVEDGDGVESTGTVRVSRRTDVRLGSWRSSYIGAGSGVSRSRYLSQAISTRTTSTVAVTSPAIEITPCYTTHIFGYLPIKTDL